MKTTAITTKLRFETKSEICSVAFAYRKRMSVWGEEFVSFEAIRVIKRTFGWQVDRADALGSVWAPWEAVHDYQNQEFSTQRAAKAAARKWWAKMLAKVP